MKYSRLLYVCLLTIVLSAAPILGRQQEKQETHVAPSLKSKVFQLQHVSPMVLMPVLQPLASGHSGALMNYSLEIRTISVRDLPENLEAIAAAIRLLDRPGIVTPRIGLNIQLSLIGASQEVDQEKSDMPSALGPVITQLERTLNFKSYRHITTISQQTLDQGKVGSSGVATNYLPAKLGSEKPIHYEYSFAGLRVFTGAGDAASIHVDEFDFQAFIPTMINPRQWATGQQKPEIEMQKVSMATGLVLREGEQVVVGTGNAGGEGRALIVVVSISRIPKQ